MYQTLAQSDVALGMWEGNSCLESPCKGIVGWKQETLATGLWRSSSPWVLAGWLLCADGWGARGMRWDGQCLLFFAFLWERCGDLELDLHDRRLGDGERERLDFFGDFDFVLLKVKE